MFNSGISNTKLLKDILNFHLYFKSLILTNLIYISESNKWNDFDKTEMTYNLEESLL